MLILALDADTKNVGWALGDEREYYAGGQVDFSGDGDVDARCCAIFVCASAMIRSREVQFLAIEKPVVGPNARTALQLARLGGMLEAAASFNGAEALRVHPSTVKAALAGGGASKAEMVKAAELAVGEVDGHHHADAVGVLFAAQRMLKERQHDEEGLR